MDIRDTRPLPHHPPVHYAVWMTAHPAPTPNVAHRLAARAPTGPMDGHRTHRPMRNLTRRTRKQAAALSVNCPIRRKPLALTRNSTEKKRPVERARCMPLAGPPPYPAGEGPGARRIPAKRLHRPLRRDSWTEEPGSRPRPCRSRIQGSGYTMRSLLQSGSWIGFLNDNPDAPDRRILRAYPF